jgi:hypothetical protein
MSVAEDIAPHQRQVVGSQVSWRVPVGLANSGCAMGPYRVVAKLSGVRPEVFAVSSPNPKSFSRKAVAGIGQRNTNAAVVLAVSCPTVISHCPKSFQ